MEAGRFTMVGQQIQDETQQRSLRWLNIGRYWICGTGLFVIAPVVVETLRDYRKWHTALVSDPSTVHFLKTTFYLGIARLIVEIGLVVAIFVILKPRPDMFAPRARSEPPKPRPRGR